MAFSGIYSLKSQFLVICHCQTNNDLKRCLSKWSNPEAVKKNEMFSKLWFITSKAVQICIKSAVYHIFSIIKIACVICVRRHIISKISCKIFFTLSSWRVHPALQNNLLSCFSLDAPIFKICTLHIFLFKFLTIYWWGVVLWCYTVHFCQVTLQN